VERRRLAGRGAGGGEIVPASRAARARLGTAAAAVGGAGAVAAWLALAAEEGAARSANGLTGGLAVLLLVAGLLPRLTFAIPLAIAFLGFEYALLLLFDDSALDTRAPFVAAALFAVAELAYFALELRHAVADEPGTYLRRVALIATLSLAVVAVGLVILALAEASGRGGGALVQLVGAVAAVGALALLARAALGARQTEES
jgi:hypothetical protein